MFFSGPSQHYYPNMNYQIPHYPPLPYPNPSTVPQQMAANQPHWPTPSMASQFPPTSTVTPALKSSKSYGDIVAEMKKEQAATAAE